MRKAHGDLCRVRPERPALPVPEIVRPGRADFKWEDISADFASVRRGRGRALYRKLACVGLVQQRDKFFDADARRAYEVSNDASGQCSATVNWNSEDKAMAGFDHHMMASAYPGNVKPNLC